MGRKVGIDRDAILQSAATLADSEGLAAVTLARVAADLGVKSPSLYNHIDGLADLHHELRRRGMEAFADSLGGPTTDDPVERLRRIAAAARRFAREHPGLYTASQAGAQPDDPVEIVERSTSTIELVAAPLRSLGVPTDHLIHTVRAFRALLHGFADLERSGGFGLPEDVDASFDLAVEQFIAGIASPG